MYLLVVTRLRIGVIFGGVLQPVEESPHGGLDLILVFVFWLGYRLSLDLELDLGLLQTLVLGLVLVLTLLMMVVEEGMTFFSWYKER